ncbi:uncharacterized protein MKK02DRAFT_23907, partial [Dioszegia hungarica]
PRSKREKRTREPDEDDRDRSERRRRHHDDESNGDRDRERRHRRHRDRSGDREDDSDRERRHRRHREREDETDEEREERRRRRKERERGHDERRSTRNASKELMPDADDTKSTRSSERPRDRERSDRRDRSRESHRSHRSRSTREAEREGRREMTREEREAEREKRDREMRDERREQARIRDERFAEVDRQRGGDRRGYDRPPRPRSPYSPRPRRGSPVYSNGGPPSGRNDAPPPPPREPPPPLDPATQVWNSIDSENRSIFISQIAARMTSSDLGLFFEDSLGPNSVKDARVVTDRQSQRSKGIGYVELTDSAFVNKALGLSGTIVMGIPIIVQLTEAERNREGKTIEQLVAAATKEMEAARPRYQREGRRDQGIQFPHLSTGLRLPPGFDPDQNPDASIPYHRLFLINVAYSLSQDDIRAVFEPFGEIDFIDQHLDHHGHPKGTAYIQFRELRAAQMALDAMNGFELAGRTIKAMAINEKSGIEDDMDATGRGPRGYGGPKLDARGRMSLMQKLARTEDAGPAASASPRAAPRPVQRADPTPFVVVSNMFNPEEETERNWDLDLAEDVKSEVESKYGKLRQIKVDKMSAGEVYMEFGEGARFADMAVQGLNGRYFGGRTLRAEFISEALFKAHM